MTPDAVDLDEHDVSVVLPTYNGAAYIIAQLDSIVRQTLRPREIVIVDDSSSDSTLESVYEYVAERTPDSLSFSIYRNPSRLGVTESFSRGIRLATGSFVALADQDDIWQANKLAYSINALILHEGVFVAGSDVHPFWAESANSKKTLFDALRLPQPVRSGDPRAVLAWLLKENFLPGMTLIARASFLKTALPVGSGWFHDHWFTLLAASQSGLAVMDIVLVEYRQHSNNVIGTGNRSRARSRKMKTMEPDWNSLLLRSKRFEIDPALMSLVRARAHFAVDTSRENITIRRALWHAVHGSYLRFDKRPLRALCRDCITAISALLRNSSSD